MNGLNVVSYLTNSKKIFIIQPPQIVLERIPLANKLLYCEILITIIISYVMNIWDLSLYAPNTCQDTHSQAPMYINFLALIFIKLGVFNYVTAEMNSKLDYDLKFPFLIPILTLGVAANFQLPLVVYNYNKCTLRSPFFELIFGYFVVDIIAGVIIAAFTIGFFWLLFSPKINLSHNKIKMIKTIVYFVCICTMLLMNILFIAISLSQANHFSLTLLTENILYWTLVIAGAVIFIIKKKYKKEVFLSLDELLERQNTAEQESPEILMKKKNEKMKPKFNPKTAKVSPIFNNLEHLPSNSSRMDHSSKPFGIRDEKDGTAFVEQSFSKVGDDPLDHTLPLSSRGI